MFVLVQGNIPVMNEQLLYSVKVLIVVRFQEYAIELICSTVESHFSGLVGNGGCLDN